MFCTNCPSNCNSCPTSDTICASCANGFYVNSSSLCSTCTINNCKTCLKVGLNLSCTLCNSGYRLASGQCIVCPSNCNTCTLSGSTSICSQCLSGYYLTGGACSIVTVTINNCQIYSSSSSCSSCVSGYYLKYSQCYPCSLLCTTCDGDGFGNCLTCNSLANLFNKMCLINNFPTTSTYNLYFSFPNALSSVTSGSLSCDGNKFMSGTKITLQLNNLRGYKIDMAWKLYSENGSTTFTVALDNSQGTYSLSETTSSTDKYILCSSSNTTTYEYINIASKRTFNTITKTNTLTFSTNNKVVLSLHELIVTVYRCN